MEFKDKVAVVTGGSRGIGRAICLELAKNGCDIAFNYHKSEDQARTLVEEIESLGCKAMSFKIDVSNFEKAKEMIKVVKKNYGKIDFLINNAGIVRVKLLMSMSEDDWDEILDINLKGVFNFSRSVIYSMMKQKSGSILNISSISGVVGMPGQVNYSSSKAGIIGFTKALAKEVAKVNITVNALALGYIETDILDENLDTKMKENALNYIPLQRFGTVEETAQIATFLLSDKAKYITGQVIQVDGGLAM